MNEKTSPPADPLALGASVSRRKCLLFAVPVLREDLCLIQEAVRSTAADPSTWELPRHFAALRVTINVIESAADGEANPGEEIRVRETIMRSKEAAIMDQDFEIAVYFRNIQNILARPPDDPERSAPHTQAARLLRSSSLAGHTAFHGNTPDRHREKQHAKAARRTLCNNYLTEAFGPFPSVSFSPSWRTDTATSLARIMYESRDFSAMPILADALQDAGCDSEHILKHCRDTNQVHVRGCWVVDLVLDKQ